MPPGEQFEQETFHLRRALNPVATRAFCHLPVALSSRGLLVEAPDHIRPTDMDDIKRAWIRSDLR
jgi:hypothetical protein